MLYQFSSATFTPGGATFQTGPTLAQARTGLTGAGTDTWKTNTAFFNVQNGIQLWTVPRSGVYRIEAAGAQGGNPTSRIGGRGARIAGDFELTQGEIIQILVGQQGQTGGHSQNLSQSVTAGGGGSFVVRTPYNTNESILVVAGGGGGGANNTWTVADGRPAVITANGNTGQQGTAVFGVNGGGATGDGTGGPAAGFFGNGAIPSGTPAVDSAQSFVNGGRGGRNARSWGGPEIYGGFGGGGGGGGLAAGGGGGYSGGAAGAWSATQAGGGGGSLNNGTNQSNIGDTVTGPGSVTITFLFPAPPPGASLTVVNSGLYSFATARFTPGTQTGTTGPSLTVARDGLTSVPNKTWANNTSFFNMTTNGYQRWTVPETGNYTIIARGAEGGQGSSIRGGLGAIIQGSFNLIKGEIITVAVGQQGTNNANDGGGGGGTFVIRENGNTPLVIAGGGGGGSASGFAGPTGSSKNANLLTNGHSTNSGTGGINGNGGTGGVAGGGGGFLSNGSGTRFGTGYQAGLIGGGAAAGQGIGGFGGGGGGGGTNGAGGGGGFSGGAFSNWSNEGAGGGSINNGTDQLNTLGNSGNGSVDITINFAAKTPIPSNGTVTSITRSAASINEGQSVTFTVNTSNIPNNSQPLSWRVKTDDDTVGDQVFLNPGIYDWLCPDGVTSISALCVGGGGGGGILWSSGGGGGGGLAWKNNIPVIPGERYRVQVGAGGRFSASSRDIQTLGGNSVFQTTPVSQLAPTVEVLYDTPGTYQWTCPQGITSINAVCIGGGGGGVAATSNARGGGGGGLGWKNNIPVIPGQSYTVQVGAGGTRSSFNQPETATSGGNSFFISLETVAGLGGGAGLVTTTTFGGAGGTFVGDGGGNGGIGGAGGVNAGGGGGAGGYTGNGGSGYVLSTSITNGSGISGNGGGGGGGGSGGSGAQAGGGGGVGVYGAGTSGLGGSGSTGNAAAGRGGSNGTTGSSGTVGSVGGTGAVFSNGGLYGGGGGSSTFATDPHFNGQGGNGAVRLMFAPDRSFPNNAQEISPLTVNILETDVVGYGGGRGGPNSTAAGPGYGGGWQGQGGGRGGNGDFQGNWQRAGGGAGGYTGNGGDSGNANGTSPDVGSGGGAAGGFSTTTNGTPAGGGVGLYGRGEDGLTGGTSSGGGGGSGGGQGFNGTGGGASTTVNGLIAGGRYGGGGGGSGTITGGGPGGQGAVRLVWGLNRSFPSAAFFNSDFSTGRLSGEVDVIDNVATLSMETLADFVTDGDKDFSIEFSGGNILEISPSVTVIDTSLDPTYSISPDVTTINEGSTVNFTVNSTGTFNGTVVYWNTIIETGTINSSDFEDNRISGTAEIAGNTAVISRTLRNDFLTEGTESFRLEIRTQNPAGPIVATSAVINISDTSLSSSYTITSNTQTTLGETLDNSDESLFDIPGTYEWICPPNVSSVSVVCVGGGGGGNANWSASAGAGGGLGWKNNISVIPGQSYTVQVGAGGLSGASSNATAGGNSFFINLTTVAGYGGGNPSSNQDTNGPNKNGFGGGWFGDGGGAGGTTTAQNGGGGAGGYTGIGGNGGNATTPGAAGQGGGGGGGTFRTSTDGTPGGGGVGLYGQGVDGIGSIFETVNQTYLGWRTGGFGGSEGQNGSPEYEGNRLGTTRVNNGGAFGGGAGGSGTTRGGGNGGSGAVRIIWGEGRSFPFRAGGRTVLFTISSQNVTNGTTVFWTTKPINGTLEAADFTDLRISGSLVINNNQAILARVIVADNFSEGAEQFQIELRENSITGPIIAISPTITIADTSFPPFKLTSSKLVNINRYDNFQSIVPVVATGGVIPYSFAISPSLPAGLTFNTETGEITGNPTESVYYSLYTVTVTDSSLNILTETFSLITTLAFQRAIDLVVNRTLSIETVYGVPADERLGSGLSTQNIRLQVNNTQQTLEAPFGLSAIVRAIQENFVTPIFRKTPEAVDFISQPLVVYQEKQTPFLNGNNEIISSTQIIHRNSDDFVSLNKSLRYLLSKTTFSTYDNATFTTAGSYQWTVPPGVNFISVLGVGGGGGGAQRSSGGSGGDGGSLTFVNNIPVVPGDVYDIYVGSGGLTGASGQSGEDTTMRRNGIFLVEAATGGIVSRVTIDNVDYTVHTFTTSGTFTVSRNLSVDYLIVGGGSSGSKNNFVGAGGGGGGVRSGQINVTPQSYTIAVGAGGTVITASNTSGIAGSISSAFGLSTTAPIQALNSSTSGNGIASTAGTSTDNAGGAGSGTTNSVGLGGNGVLSTINGSSFRFGAGGGGGTTGATRNLGGNDGGGSSNAGTLAALNGAPNSGSGGGGGSVQTGADSGAGGSGIVIIRYPTILDQEAPPVLVAKGGAGGNQLVILITLESEYYHSTGLTTIIPAFTIGPITTNLTYSITSGSLPPEYSLNTSNGEIKYLDTATLGPVEILGPFTLSASDGTVSVSQTFSIRREKISLYQFTTANFTPGSQIGRLGPSLAVARTGLTGTGTDTWKNNTEFFNVTDGIQYWTVPEDGVYTIEAWGAAGGSNFGISGANGGLGARMRGDFTLSAGEVIRILVGQQGLSTGNTCAAGSGGGGTFVVRSPYNTLGSALLVAGGGGGGATTSGVQAGIGGTTSNSGTFSNGSNVSGGQVAGTGGAQPPSTPCGIIYVSGSGSGFLSSGGGPVGAPGSSSNTGGGFAFVDGGFGGDRTRGTNGSDFLDGGFGGGGMGNYGAGAGGGYSGGGGGAGTSCSCSAWRGGGGGGSINNGTNQSNSAAVRSGNGQVTITKVA
jgi:hypothetical protein